MLARLQQVLVGSVGLLIALVSAWAAWAGHWSTFVAVVALGLTGHAIALAFEFGVMAKVNATDPAPRATLSQTAAAWWGEARQAPRVFGWRQPFRSNTWPDFLPAAPRTRGVLLVHGFVCNRGLWNGWMRRLRAEGIAHVAVNLEPVFGSIEDYTGTIEQAVSQLEQSTGLAPLIVAHSMGGLAARRWWVGTSIERIHHLIALGTPHHGTWLARWARSENARQMQIGSPWRDTLVEAEGEVRRARITCFYSHCDNIVFPASTATLAGASNHHIAAVAHVHMVDHPAPLQEALRHLR